MSKRLPETVAYQTANNECHKKCRGLIRCANILIKDSFYYVENCTDFSKAAAFAARICKTELSNGITAVEHKRLLSAITNEGVKSYESTVATLCDRVYVIKDEYGAASAFILAKIRDYALEKHYEIFSCYCPLDPTGKLEHIIIPELKLGFVTQTPYNDFSGIVPYRVINSTRFTDVEKLKLRKQWLSFNKKAALELINAASVILREAKAIHDKLELQYNDAVDFEGVDKKTAQVLSKLAMRYK